MLDIIHKSIEAHGGLARRREVEKVSANFHPTGLALDMRGQISFGKDPKRVTVDTRDQRVRVDPF